MGRGRTGTRNDSIDDDDIIEHTTPDYVGPLPSAEGLEKGDDIVELNNSTTPPTEDTGPEGGCGLEVVCMQHLDDLKLGFLL